MEASFDEIAGYCESLAQLSRPLRPLVVYLRHENVERAVRAISSERGEAWMQYQVDWKLKGPHPVRRNLVDLEGLIALYQDYRRITDALFDRRRLEKLVIENSARDWAQYNQQVCERLVCVWQTHLDAQQRPNGASVHELIYSEFVELRHIQNG